MIYIEKLTELKQTKEEQIETNKLLIKRYPFLLPRNRFTDKISEDYDYSYTELDCLEEGWRISFGSMLLEELRHDLMKENLLYKYRIDQIKEKYGLLCWYSHNYSTNVNNIIEKYSQLSEHICGHCGRPDCGVSTRGWIYPICKECWDKNENRLVNEGILKTPTDYKIHFIDGRMPDSYSYLRFKPGNEAAEEVTVNIKETADKIRENWRRNHDDL